jgi:hypothetical protein
MQQRGMIFFDDINHPDHAAGVAGNGKARRVRCFSAREPFTSTAGIATVAQFALLEVGRLDDIVRTGVAGSSPGIA